MEHSLDENGVPHSTLRVPRLRKHAPAPLQLEPRSEISAKLCENGAASRSPIPLLSPLLVQPPPLPADAERGDNCEEMTVQGEAGVWLHPALTVVEPASLLPLFQSHCAVANTTKATPVGGQIKQIIGYIN
ncbi:hypothetical protein HPP92_018644 [Vanilla planifolia]|uniref:Uncharacterized protein n=1 Tax=Vanilla planifolia TaxID=51239 RepID=A0A835QBI4_VANPL|nr:hypothetical protein HPP92_019235 [Vanilla planifolia]KAG0469316.1 hypothetical protein HPP92_018644 [Vanilla planifolia]